MGGFGKEEGSQPVPGDQRYFSVRTLDTRDRNLSQAAWASAVKSAGKCEATVTSTQWDSSWGRAAVLRWAGAQGAETPPPPRPQPGPAHLEVERVHAQDVGVQLAELGQRARHIVDVLDRVAQGGHHLGAVRAQVRRARVQVEVRKVGLGLRVAGEEPAQWASRSDHDVLIIEGNGTGPVEHNTGSLSLIFCCPRLQEPPCPLHIHSFTHSSSLGHLCVDACSWAALGREGDGALPVSSPLLPH